MCPRSVKTAGARCWPRSPQQALWEGQQCNHKVLFPNFLVLYTRVAEGGREKEGSNSQVWIHKPVTVPLTSESCLPDLSIRGASLTTVNGHLSPTVQGTLGQEYKLVTYIYSIYKVTLAGTCWLHCQWSKVSPNQRWEYASVADVQSSPNSDNRSLLHTAPGCSTLWIHWAMVGQPFPKPGFCSDFRTPQWSGCKPIRLVQISSI